MAPRGGIALGLELPPIGPDADCVEAVDGARDRPRIRRHPFGQDDFDQYFVPRPPGSIEQATKLVLLRLAQFRLVIGMVENEAFDDVIEGPVAQLDRNSVGWGKSVSVRV